MKDNGEVKIAIAIGIVVLLICFIIYVVNNNQLKTENIDIKVYKLFTSEEDETKHYYGECILPDDDLAAINKEFYKIRKKSVNDRLLHETIYGDYKIVSGDSFIAFDDNDKSYVYDGVKNVIYNYDSPIYELIINRCGLKEKDSE